MTTPMLSGRAHVAALVAALPGLDTDRLDNWGSRLAAVLLEGGRVLVAGNGGSAAQAQHFTAELVGRYRDDRQALSALALHAETSSLTAIGNDYGYEASFSRQVEAHGRRGDVLLALSTSGTSPNVLAAVRTAHRRGLLTWALTGAEPNPVADASDEAVCAEAASTATVQEVHQVAVHLICAAVDLAVAAAPVVDLTGTPAADTPRSHRQTPRPSEVVR